VDWKPKWAVQAKIRDKQKFTIILIGWNPKRAIYAKVKDHDKVTTSVRHGPLGASRYQKTPNLKHLQIKNLKQGLCASIRHDPLGASSDQKTSNLRRLQLKDSKRGQFKVVRENNSYSVQCTLPIYLPFSKNFQRSGEPRHWQVTTQFIKFEPVPIYLELSFILHTKFLLFFDGNTWIKNFQNTKTFLHLLKSVNDKHTFFEFMSSGSIHQHPPRERLHSGRETWLGTVERTSALSKMQS